jgi:2-oxoisovalerate dehydrogenase E2 component (dihydrolipoyl transacylase)
MKTFYLPDLGEGLSKAEIIKWHVKTGDRIIKDQTMVTVETTKSLVDIPSPVNGTIDIIHAKQNEEINVDQPIVSFITKERINNSLHQQSDTTQTTIRPISSINNITKAQPAARHLAKKLNIDLNTIQTDKIISLDDVLKISNAETDKVLPKRRRQMCELATLSHTSVTSSTVTELININNWYNSKDFLAYVLQVITKTLIKNPALNAHYIPNKKYLQYEKKVDLGIAMQTDDGLFVPKIDNVQKLSIELIRNNLETLKLKAQNQELTLNHTYQPTFIVSNFGSLGAGQFGTPMILPPAVGTIALGAVFKHPTIVDDSLQIQPHLPVSLSFNHRVVYGAEAIKFLKELKENLQ